MAQSPSYASDWRHAEEILAAGKIVFTELKDLCVWNKTSAGTGTFYRSKHELIFVFKKGTGAACELVRTRRDGAFSQQRLGLPRGQQHRAEPDGGTRDASHRQADEVGR